MRHFAFTALLLLSACSSHADAPPGGPGGGRGGMGRAPLSLAGEPLGRLAPDESAYADIVEGWAKGLDANRDGFLSPDELKPDIARFFKEVDADKDGAINARELGEYRQARLAALRNGGPGSPPPDGGPSGGTGADRPPPPHEGVAPSGRGGMMGGGADKVMEADRNLDFRVTAAELETLALGRLKVLDTDKDGRTSLAEIRAGAISAYNERPTRGGPGGMGGRPGGGGGPPGEGGGPPGGGRGP